MVSSIDHSDGAAQGALSSILVKYPPGVSVLSLDGPDFRELFQAATFWLEQHHVEVNALNVFPVPDGDTGTNMLLTMQSVLQEIDSVQTGDASALVQAAAHGALMGARGNSGVILSQILRGIAHGLAGEDLVDAAEIIKAFSVGAETAYRGVVRPVEGTMLTVIREVAEGLHESGPLRDLRVLFELATHLAADSVEKTPRLLAVLAEAGVVDAGGRGLQLLLEGMHRCLQGLPVSAGGVSDARLLESVAAFEGEYGYDVQCVVVGQGLQVDRMREALTGMGDSVLVVGDEQAVKVHVHTDEPGTPLNYCAVLGRVDRVIVENMQLQYERFLAESTARPGADGQGGPVVAARPGVLSGGSATGRVGTVVVSAGDGLDRVFDSLGVHAIVPGGQSMNPSTEELLRAVEGLRTEEAIILPNNKNVIMAAELAAEQAAEQFGKRVRVVRSRSIPQGISALLMLNQQADLESNVRSMTDALDAVQTGEVTTAVRDVRLGDITVSEGDFIGLKNDELVARGDTPEEVVYALLEAMEAEDAEIITLYPGEPLEPARAESLASELADRFADQEVELIHGGQPHYHYILSVE